MRKNNIINDWLEENQDHEIESFVKMNLAIVNKVRLALETKGWSKARFAEEMGKRPSEVSKWLTGMHNLTLKSIVKMELALGVDLIHTEPIKEYKYVPIGIITSKTKTKTNKYQPTTDYQEYQLDLVS